mgnify:CR=1 FL=1
MPWPAPVNVNNDDFEPATNMATSSLNALIRVFGAKTTSNVMLCLGLRVIRPAGVTVTQETEERCVKHSLSSWNVVVTFPLLMTRILRVDVFPMGRPPGRVKSENLLNKKKLRYLYETFDTASS